MTSEARQRAELQQGAGVKFGSKALVQLEAVQLWRLADGSDVHLFLLDSDAAAADLQVLQFWTTCQIVQCRLNRGCEGGSWEELQDEHNAPEAALG